MSSSKGHVVPAEEAVDNYGADTTRFFLFASVEPWQDFNWKSEEVKDYRAKLKKFYDRTLEMHGEGVERENNNLDRYVISRLQKTIEESTEGLEDFQTRKAGLKAFFELNSLINKYRSRADELNLEVVEELIETQIRLMAPFTPHICEELWSETGHETLVSEEEWPEADEHKIDPEIERAQEFVENTVSDIRELSEIVDGYGTIKVITAKGWKRDLFSEMKEVIDERPDFGEAMGRLVEGRKENADTVKKLLQEYMEDPGAMPEEIFSSEREMEILEENKEFLENEFEVDVIIETEEESGEEKASRAEPGKPAIVMK